jgi:hypothetical protein
MHALVAMYSEFLEEAGSAGAVRMPWPAHGTVTAGIPDVWQGVVHLIFLKSPDKFRVLWSTQGP